MKSRVCTFLLLLFSIVGSLSAFPAGISLEQLVMDTWNDRSGLPSNSILDIVQDTQGYIWIASYDGLIRFDGRSFKLFTKESKSGFNSNSARCLLCSQDGTLWIGTNTDGLYSYRRGIFTPYGKDQGLPDLSIRSLAFDDLGKLWVSTSAGIAVSDGDKFKTVTPGEGISNFFLPLRDGSILTGTSKKGLWKVGDQGLQPWLKNTEIDDAAFYAATIDQRNQLWLGTGSGSILIIRGNGIINRLEPEELKGGTVKDFLTDADGTLWIATDKGLFYGRDESFRLYSEANGLPNNSVTSICQDQEGSLWVGTERGGLVKFSPGKFVNITQREGLAGNSVNSAVEDQYGSLWVGSDQGLAFLPSDKDPWHQGKERRKLVDQALADLGKTRIRQIRLDTHDGLWFATYSDLGLYHLDSTGIQTLTQAQGLPANRVRLSMEDSQGRLWIGTTAGLVRQDAQGIKIFGKPDGLRNEFILSILEDSQGTVWVGLDGGGLARLEPDGSFKSWTTAEGLAGNVVFRIFADKDKRLWIATSDGLSLYTPESSSPFRNYRAQDGLLSDSIYQIMQEISNGNLWIVTSRGIAIMEPEVLTGAQARLDKKRIRILDRLDGLAGQPAANSWAFMNSQGVMYFPTIGGLSVFNPQSVNQNPNAPPVYLETVSLDGNIMSVPDHTWTVPPDTQRVAFQFTALSYMVPQKVGFQYLLEGYDTQWQSPLNSERSAVYTNLPPGTYTFKVRAWNNDGVVNESGAFTTLVKEPRFTQTAWFLTLVALALVGLGFLINFLRMHAVERHRIELEKQVAQRTVDLNREKQKSEALLLNILPIQVAEELKTHGSVQPQIHQDVAVMFADLVNFTEKSSHIGPAQTIQELNSIFSAFDEIATTYGCERIKTVGDAYLCVCGLNSSLNPQARAIALSKCALAMLEYLKTREDPLGLAWELRVGIHSGPVVAGVVGIRKYIYDIFGDTVNTAFRMQSESHPGSITLSGHAAALVGKSLPFQCRGETQVKGKGVMELWCMAKEE